MVTTSHMIITVVIESLHSTSNVSILIYPQRHGGMSRRRRCERRAGEMLSYKYEARVGGIEAEFQF